MNRVTRRIVGTTLTLAAATWLFVKQEEWAVAFAASPQEFTGWLLVGVLVLLTLFNLRKKITRLPIGRVYHWATVHYYVGLFAGFAFLFHTGFEWPTAWMNWVILVLFALLFLTGIVGLVLSRTIPGRLTLRAEELIFERIPKLRARLAFELQTIIDSELRDSENLALSEFAIEHLVPFFSGHKNRIGHLFRVHRHRDRLLFRLNAVSRFLNPKEQLVKDRISDMILAKDDLDYTYAHQSLLKYWLFVHIPLTYALLLLLPLHVAWGLILR